ncbi:MAG: glycosyltransferase family 4 protein [bacterium]|nr:glycosyltransferase family 4 protein [bacterium]
MRLLFVIDNLASGGAQRQLVSLALGLHERGHSIEFFIYYPKSRHFADQLEELKIPIHEFAKVRRFSIKIVAALRRQISKGAYDGILSFLRTPGVYAELARFGMDRPKLIVSERGPPSPNTTAPGRFLARQLHRLADHVTVNSHHERLRIEGESDWLRGRISTIYNGVDLNVFHPPQNEIPRDKGDPLRLLAIGTVNPHKNMMGLIRALALVREKRGDLPLLVRWAGKRSQNPEGERTFQQTDNLISELDLKSNWEWLGERKDIPSLLRQHDAVVHPSTREGLPNAICEGLASGRPILAGGILDHPRLVQQGVRGLLFDPRDPEDIAKTLLDFCELQPDVRKQMGKAARAFAETELSLPHIAEIYEQRFVRLGCPRNSRDA